VSVIAIDANRRYVSREKGEGRDWERSDALAWAVSQPWGERVRSVSCTQRWWYFDLEPEPQA
jgi:hypothetical protein